MEEEMKIDINKTEANMLLESIRELELGVYEMEEEDEGSSAYTPADLVALQKAKEKLLKVMKK
tara:strand:- start:146 stop:334 length:189 start_codon:yes stop_codon:yes gene_type:complete